MKEPQNIRIVEGNAFTLICPLSVRTWDGDTPIDTPIDCRELENVSVKVNGRAWEDYSLEQDGVHVGFPATLAKNTYSVEIFGTLNGSRVRAGFFELVTIVAWNYQSDAEDHEIGSPVLVGSAHLLSGDIKGDIIDAINEQTLKLQGEDTTATLTALKSAIAALYGGDTTATLAALKTAIANIDIDTTDLAKAYALQAVQDDINTLETRVGTAQDADTDATLFGKLAAIITAIANIDIDTSTLAKQGSNENATNTAILAAFDVLKVALQGGDISATLSALKTAIENIQMDTSALAQRTDVKDGNDTVIGMLKDQTYGLAALLAAIGQGGGGGGDATLANQQIIIDAVKNNNTTALAELLSQTHGLAAILAAIPTIPTDYAKQGNDATATNTAILAAIAALVIPTVQQIQDGLAKSNELPTDYSKQGNDTTATNTAILAAIAALVIPTVSQIQNGLATETSVKDGNDTAIAMLKNATYGLAALQTLVSGISGYAMETSVKDGNDTAIGLLKDATNGLSAIRTLVAAISGYALQGNDNTATNTALLNVLNSISTNMYKGVPITSKSGNATIQPNEWNIWSSPIAADLTITKGTDIPNIMNEYIIRFTLDSTWVTGTNTITFSGFTLDWNGGSVPTWNAGSTYEISIVNNIALWAEIKPAS